MKDANIITYLLLGFGFLFLVLGVFYKKWNLYNNLKPRKKIGQLLHDGLGENGLQKFYIFFGILFLALASVTIYSINGGDILSSKYSNKTNDIQLVFDHGSIMNTTIKKANELDDSWNEGFVEASFKNNYLNEVPDFIWKLNNLKTLDLTNNELKQIPLVKLKNSPIEKIILIGNPINPEVLANIKKLGIEVIL